MDLLPFNKFAKVENLYDAWDRFTPGKRERPDVVAFERRLENQLQQLSEDLSGGLYVHGDYKSFFVRDPKFRIIHKAKVRDRVVHQALYSVLYRLFDRRFYFDSYSSRVGKGTQAAVLRVWEFIRKESSNFNQQAYVLHGDVDDFFASVDHQILLTFIRKRLKEPNYLRLCTTIIDSFHVTPGKGVPLGNLTSQIFANIYLHELDYFVKQTLGVEKYVRYNDDFYLVSKDKSELSGLSLTIRRFLAEKLTLSLPEEKTILRSLNNGVDILGVVAFPYGLVPRKRVRTAVLEVAAQARKTGYNSYVVKQLNSYIGLLGISKSFLLKERLRLSIG